MPIAPGWAAAAKQGDVPSSGNLWFDTGSMEGYKAAVADKTAWVQPEYQEGTPFSQGWEYERQKKGDVPSPSNNWFGTGSQAAADKASLVTPVGTYDPVTNEFVMSEQTAAAEADASGGGTTTAQPTPIPFVQQPSTVPSEEYLKGQIRNPEIPTAGFQRSVAQKVQANELLDPSVGQIAAPTRMEPATSATNVQTVAADPIAQQEAIKAQEIEADKAVAEEGIVPPEATMQGQMANLMDDVASGNVPWADEAMRNAQAIMLERGLGKSSMTGAAIGAAILEAAMPIAQFDAQVFGQMNLQNLRNRQETMLSNTAATNVAKQMNAQSVNEVNKFMSSMRDGVLKFNETTKNAMDQVSAIEANKANLSNSQFNAQRAQEMSLVHAQREDQANKFNAENALGIQKSNAEWRRTTNTANTAAANSANMINAQNYFNISQQAQANLWQRSRDVFQWANQSAENDRDRAFQMTMYTLQMDDYLNNVDQAQKDNLFAGIGNFAFDIFKSYVASSVMEAAGE